MTTPIPDFSELPDVLLRSIAQRIETRNDILRFRAVCKKFQSLLPAPPKRSSFQRTTLRIPYPVCFTPVPVAHYLLNESTIYAIQPLHEVSNPTEVSPTWVLNVEELENGRVRIKDTLSRSVFNNLSKSLPRTLNLLDYEVTAITKVYELELLFSYDFDIAIHTSMCKNNMIVYFLEKVVVSDEYNHVMVMHTGGKLAVWRQGDDEWNDLSVSDFEDIIYHSQKFYAITGDGITIAVDCNTLNVTFVVAEQQPRLRDGIFKYFMKLEQDLFLIAKYWLYGYPNTSFKEKSDTKSYPVEMIVFKLDEDLGHWVETRQGFEDRVLFVGDSCTYSLSANGFPGSKGNSIFFYDALFSELGDAFPGWLGGIFNLEDGNSNLLSASPEYSGIFWPPPAWLR